MLSTAPSLVLLFVSFCFCSNTVPITTCTTGRDTQYTNNQQAGECGYGTLVGPMGPGYLYIAAASDNTDPNFGGYSNASLCGQCFELTTAEGAVRLMITDHCPDCPTLQPHFDCSPEAAAILTGGHSNLGFMSNSFRKVACDVVGNVKVQFKTGSSSYFVGLLFANHRVGIANTIQVKENGMTSFYTVQRQPWNFFEFSPQMATPTPMTVIVTSIFGDNIQFTLNSITALAIIDTGGQFPAPIPVGYNCTSCPAPPVNNGQIYIYNNTFFPELTGVWLPATEQQWADWSGRTWIQNSTDPYSGQYSSMTVMNAWDTLNFGCNVPAPKTSIISVDFAVRLQSGTTSDTTAWFDSYPPITLPPLNTSWIFVTIPVANNSAITGTVSNFLVQNGGTQLTYFFDEIKFVLPPQPTCGNTPIVYFPSSSSTSLLYSYQIMIFFVLFLVKFSFIHKPV